MSNANEVTLSAKATEVLATATAVLGKGLTKLFTSKVKADDSAVVATGKVADKLRTMNITSELCIAPKKEGDTVWFIGHGVSANPDMPASLARRVISRPLSEMVYSEVESCWQLAADHTEDETGEVYSSSVVNIVGEQHTRQSVHDSLKALHMYGKSMADPKHYGQCFNDYCIDPSTVTEDNKKKIQKLKSDASSAIGKYFKQLQDREDGDELMERQVAEDVDAKENERAPVTQQRIDRSASKPAPQAPKAPKERGGDAIIVAIKAFQEDEKPSYEHGEVMNLLRLVLKKVNIADTTLEE
jgi:hypothetical protein|tara:strand:+ start:165 stop:1064 length:900 start_codon:yes stop_codon:yes gene_type:complete